MGSRKTAITVQLMARTRRRTFHSLSFVRRAIQRATSSTAASRREIVVANLRVASADVIETKNPETLLHAKSALTKKWKGTGSKAVTKN